MNKLYLVSITLSTTEIAKTIDATPLSPDYEIRPICLIEGLNGAKRTDETSGLAINVRNTIIINDGIITIGKSIGVTKSPSRKNIITYATSVETSKKCTKYFLWVRFELPKIIPHRYTLKYTFPLKT